MSKHVTGTKADTGKPEVTITPIELPAAANRAFAYGAEKYEVDNWKMGIAHSRIANALIRHTWAYLQGEFVDPESGLSHVDHMAANVAMLAYYEKNPEKYVDFNDLGSSKKEPTEDDEGMSRMFERELASVKKFSSLAELNKYVGTKKPSEEGSKCPCSSCFKGAS